MNSKILKHIYILVTIAFIFGVTKYFFVDHVLKARFFIFELVAFLILIYVIYLADKSIRSLYKSISEKENVIVEQREDYTKRISQLESQIEDLINKENKVSDFNVEEKRVIEKIKDGINEFNDQNFNSELKILYALSHQFEIVLGIYYRKDEHSSNYIVIATYGISKEIAIRDMMWKDGIHAQSVADGEVRVLNEIDESYFDVVSCSGSGKPRNLYFLPVKKGDQVIGLVELATFKSVEIASFWNGINEFLVNSGLIL